MIITIKEIEHLSEPMNICKKFEADINSLVPIDGEHTENTLTWCSLNNQNALINVKKRTTIITHNDVNKNNLTECCNYIFTENPRRLFQLIIAKYFAPKSKIGISPKAVINSNVIVGKNVYIGHNVIIEDNCIIGDNTSIDHNTVIKENTQIGNDVIIGANCVIGGCGYGYEKNYNGDYELILHIGNVILENGVEIGQSCCIDRAMLGSTIVGQNVKLDNHVHIAHGVKVGRNSILTAHVMIAGSTKIGQDVWIGPSSAIMNKIKIADKAFIGLGAVVIRDIETADVVAGNPARVLKKQIFE